MKDLSQKLQIGGVGALISVMGAGIRDAGGVKKYIKDLLWVTKSGFSLESPLPSGSNGNSGIRNFYAGLSSILIGIDSSVEGPIVEEALMKILDVTSIAGFVVMENARRRNATKVSSESSGSNVALEN